MTNESLKKRFLLVTYAFVLVLLLLNIKFIWNFAFGIIVAMMPFVYGIAMAYIINWIYGFIYRRSSKVKDKYKKTFALIFAYVIILVLTAFFLVIVVPQVINSITRIIDKCVEMFPEWKAQIEKFFDGSPFDDAISKIMDKWDSYLTAVATPIMNFTKDFAIKLYNWVIGFVISIYLVAEKDKLISQFSRLLQSIIPKRVYVELLEASWSFHDVFGRFLKGKLLEALFVGILCFAGTIILRLPYSVLISVIVAVTNIIPFFGPIIGAVPCILILLVESPMQALYFSIFSIILLQVDANLIGPKVVGNKVGMSGVFMIFSVLLGGALGGFVGMVLGVPVFAVIYSLIKRFVIKRECLREDS